MSEKNTRLQRGIITGYLKDQSNTDVACIKTLTLLREKLKPHKIVEVAHLCSFKNERTPSKAIFSRVKILEACDLV